MLVMSIQNIALKGIICKGTVVMEITETILKK